MSMYFLPVGVGPFVWKGYADDPHYLANSRRVQVVFGTRNILILDFVSCRVTVNQCTVVEIDLNK